MKHFLCIACLVGALYEAPAQTVLKLDLEQAIDIANESSLSAYRYQNQYLSGYWAYRTYRANRLPSLTLNLTPAKYNRYITQRYDSESNMVQPA